MDDVDINVDRGPASASQDFVAGFVMVQAPPPGYAGHVGDEVVVTERTELSVYVRFDSGMVECYPPNRFAALFCRSVAPSR